LVEQRELFCELVGVRGDLLAEHEQRPVAFGPLEVAEDLVEGAVLLMV